MRKGNNCDILIVDGNVVGVNLGADYCAEHEWGINTIKSKLGIDVTKLGVEQRKISRTHSDLVWLENIQMNKKNKKDKSRWSGLYFGYHDDNGEVYFADSPYNQDLYTQWDERGFCAISSNPEKIDHLKKVYEAFATNDVVIWLGGGGVFQNAGLCIGIASKLPKEIADDWYQHDVEHNQLMADFKATGIEEKLKKAGKSYFALSPRREEDGSLIFWLNPMKQDIHNYGWFKIADLEAWTRDEGPIPMTAEQKKKRDRYY